MRDGEERSRGALSTHVVGDDARDQIADPGEGKQAGVELTQEVRRHGAGHDEAQADEHLDLEQPAAVEDARVRATPRRTTRCVR